MKNIFQPIFENELVGLADLGIQKYADDDFDVVGSSTYTPRLQLMTANSGKCKSGEFPINHYALIQDQKFNDLGEAVDIAVIAWRPKAIDMSDTDTIMTVHDVKDPEFKRIQEQSAVKESGCMFGAEYLVYIPEVAAFATFFMGSKSARRESPALKALLYKAATLKSHLIETKKYAWQTPLIVACSSPMETPPEAQLRTEVERFNNPPVDERERVEDEGERAR